MKEIKLFTGISLFFVVGLAAAATGMVGSCGGDDKPSESEIRGLCMQGCSKSKECHPEAAAFLNCETLCAPKPGSTSGSTETCTNTAAIVAKSKECLTKTACAEFEACFESVPDCQMPTSTPGAGGTTGTPGAGGTTGALPGAGGTTGTTPDAGTPASDAGSTAGCEDCMKAQTCLAAFAGDAGIPAQNYAQACAMATGMARTQFVMACQTVVMSIPGCK